MIVRSAHDLLGGTWVTTERVDEIGSVALMWLLAAVMIDRQLTQLAHAALPMLVILELQGALLAALASWVVFRLMGRDYEAAMRSAGMIAFGLGATSNALATRRVCTARFGPAQRAFLIVPIVGAFLSDFANAILTTTALNLLRPKPRWCGPRRVRQATTFSFREWPQGPQRAQTITSRCHHQARQA